MSIYCCYVLDNTRKLRSFSTSKNKRLSKRLSIYSDSLSHLTGGQMESVSSMRTDVRFPFFPLRGERSYTGIRPYRYPWLGVGCLGDKAFQSTSAVPNLHKTSRVGAKIVKRIE